MNTAAIHPDLLSDLVKLLPDKGTAVAYAVRCGDGALYVATSQHLQWRLVQLLKATAGEPSTASQVIARSGGAYRLEAFTVTKDEASAQAIVDRWIALARKKGERIATDGRTEANREAQAAAALGIRQDF